MSKFKIESVLAEVSSQVFCSTNLKEGKNAVINLLEKKRIKEEDKRNILTNLERIKTLPRLQSYVCNSLLRYEGLGVV